MNLNPGKLPRSYKYCGFVVFIHIFLAVSLPVNADLLDLGKDFLNGDYRDNSPSSSDPSNNEIASGLKEALSVGTETVVKKLGHTGGFTNDSAVHIPLPSSLKNVKKILEKVGMGKMLEDLELKMNAAAEAATPKAKPFFIQAIQEMTLDDVGKIFNGPDDAATQYFQSKMSGPLAREMSPIVSKSLAETGAAKSYDAVMSEYESLPFVPDVKSNLTEYVVQKSLDGIFHYLAIEEAAIRKNPVKRTTTLLKKVFGG